MHRWRSGGTVQEPLAPVQFLKFVGFGGENIGPISNSFEFEWALCWSRTMCELSVITPQIISHLAIEY